MRTTIEIPDRAHALFTSLAREQYTSLGKLLVELAGRGLRAGVAEAPPDCEIDPETGFPIFSTRHPVTLEDVKALEDEELDCHGPFA